MSHTLSRRLATSAAALLLASPLAADVTPQDVWADWQQLLSAYGDDASWSGVEETGGMLTIRDLVYTGEEDGVSLVVETGDIVMTDLGDGTVRLTTEEVMPIRIAGAEGSDATIEFRLAGQDLVVSGDPGALRYDITAERYEIELIEARVEGKPMEAEASFVVNAVMGSYLSSREDGRRVADQTLEARDAELFVDVKIPDAPGDYFNMTGQLRGLTFAGVMSYPEDMDMSDGEVFFSGGIDLTGGYALEQAAYVIDLSESGTRSNGSIATGMSSLDIVLGAEGISYDSAVQDVKAYLSSGDMPFPVEFEMGRYAVGFQMPVAPSDLPRTVRLELGVVDLTLGDAIWALFDSGEVLPRDPASIELALSGQALVKESLIDPEAMEDGAAPFELQSMSLDRFRVSAVGLEAGGAGSFTFDNSDFATYDGIPRPEGRAKFTIDGLNALLDNLVAMGLVPADQVMGMRMMSGMFLKATGEDSLESVVEIDQAGALRVNGQRLR